VGVQYSYLTKYAWSGNGLTGSAVTATPGPSLRPHAIDNMVWTSFRYLHPVVQARQLRPVHPLGTAKGQLLTELPFLFARPSKHAKPLI